MKKAISRSDVPHCLTPQCNGLVKPDIVFFGEPLPETFHKNRALPSEADMCIVMGTSLTVQPFASLPASCSLGVPRILINLEQVGGLGSREDDVLLLGDCDDGVRKLAAALGWEAELEARWKETLPDERRSLADQGSLAKSESEVQDLDAQVTALTAEIDEALQISTSHASHLREHLTNETKETSSKSRSISDSGHDVEQDKLEPHETPPKAPGSLI